MPFRAPVPRFKPTGKTGLASLKKRKIPDRYFFSILRLTDPLTYIDLEGANPRTQAWPDTKVLSLGIFDKAKEDALVGLGGGKIHKEGSKVADPASMQWDDFQDKFVFDYIGRVPEGQGDLLNIDWIRGINPDEARSFNKIGIKATRPVDKNELMHMGAWVHEKIDEGKLLSDLKEDALTYLGEGALEKSIELGPDLKEGPGHGSRFYGGLQLDVGTKDTLTGLRSLLEQIPSIGRIKGERTTGGAFGDHLEVWGGEGRPVDMKVKRKKDVSFEDLPNIDHVEKRFKNELNKSRQSKSPYAKSITDDELTHVSKAVQDWGIEDSWFGTPSESLMRESIEAGEAIPLTQEILDSFLPKE